MHQTEMIRLNDLVSKNHVYRTLKEHYPSALIKTHLKDLKFTRGADGYGIERLFRCLFLQFLEDLSDRELERFLEENNSAKWFCEFGLSMQTPDYSLFSKIRSRIGTDRLSKIFATVRDSLKDAGYMSEVFTFVDATHLIAKAHLWEERDKAIKKKIDKLNNEILPKVAHDKQARIGCKGKKKYWYGYKQHTSVDMPSGLINKVAVTPANVPDGKGFKHVCPSQGSAYGDKGYCSSETHRDALRRGVHLRAILRNNMKRKNRDLDRWITKLRSPYERVFSKQNKRIRYIGIAKNQFASFMHALTFNMKRLTVIPPPIPT